MGDLEFDFEQELETKAITPAGLSADPAPEPTGRDRPRNYRQTVCTYWLRGLCMKGDSCGFLHQFDPARMPVCPNLLRTGVCKDIDCPYKHTTDEIRECNMYKLGFCIYGPACRFKHSRLPGPPPDPERIEAAKPREFRNVNVVANQANDGIIQGPLHGRRGTRGPAGNFPVLPFGMDAPRRVHGQGRPRGGRGRDRDRDRGRDRDWGGRDRDRDRGRERERSPAFNAIRY